MNHTSSFEDTEKKIDFRSDYEIKIARIYAARVI